MSPGRDDFCRRFHGTHWPKRGQEQLTDGDPDLNENCEELQDIDVKPVAINGGLMVIVTIVPGGSSWNPRGDEVGQGDAPHVIEFTFTGPSPESPGRGIGTDRDSGDTRNHEADGTSPGGVRWVVSNGGP